MIEGVTIGAGAGGYCFRVRGRFRGFCDQGGGVEGCAKARGMRLTLMAHFALVVRKRSRIECTVSSTKITTDTDFDDIVRARGTRALGLT